MLDGLLLALLTGACWCVIGIVFSQAADRGLHPALMCALCGGGVALITATWIDWAALGGSGQALVIACMLLSGLASTAGMMALQTAMRRGGHGAAWAVAQCGLVCPFLVAVLLHGERPGLLPWFGLACIVCSLALLAERRPATGPGDGRWFAWAILAWLLIGLQQSAFQWPSLVSDQIDPAGLRVPLMCAAGTVAAIVALGFNGASRSPAPRGWQLLALLALIGIAANVIGQPAIAAASDRLAGLGAAGIAFPVAIATCIALFVAYSCIHRRERPAPRSYLGLGCCICGVVLMSC